MRCAGTPISLARRHDGDLKNRERDLNLRKDVYLAASETIAAGFATLARYVDLSIPHEKLTEGFRASWRPRRRSLARFVRWIPRMVKPEPITTPQNVAGILSIYGNEEVQHWVRRLTERELSGAP